LLADLDLRVARLLFEYAWPFILDDIPAVLDVFSKLANHFLRARFWPVTEALVICIPSPFIGLSPQIRDSVHLVLLILFIVLFIIAIANLAIHTVVGVVVVTVVLILIIIAIVVVVVVVTVVLFLIIIDIFSAVAVAIIAVLIILITRDIFTLGLLWLLGVRLLIDRYRLVGGDWLLNVWAFGLLGYRLLVDRFGLLGDEWLLGVWTFGFNRLLTVKVAFVDPGSEGTGGQ